MWYDKKQFKQFLASMADNKDLSFLGKVKYISHTYLKGKRFDEMVFCYQNCSGLLREKNVLVIEKNLLKFEAEGRELQIF